MTKRKLLNSMSVFYQYSYGCGAVAIYNSLHFFNKIGEHNDRILSKFSKELKEDKYGSSTNAQMTKVLERYFDVIKMNNYTIKDIRDNFKKGRIAIILHYDCEEVVEGVGHYTFLYGSEHLTYDSSKTIYYESLENTINKKCPLDNASSEIWFLS